MVDKVQNDSAVTNPAVNNDQKKSSQEKLDDAIKLADPDNTSSWLRPAAMRILKLLSADQVANMSIDSLILMVMLERGQSMENLVREQAGKIAIANKRLAALGEIRAALAEFSNDGKEPDKVVEGLNQALRDKIDAIAKREDVNINIDWSKFTNDKGQVTQGKLNSLISALDSQSQSITNLQTMEMTKLQDYSQKMNQAYELASNFLKKVNDTKSGTISNLR